MVFVMVEKSFKIDLEQCVRFEASTIEYEPTWISIGSKLPYVEQATYGLHRE